MPRYFLHVRNQSELMEDPEGQECDSVEAAVREATQAARDLMAECLRNGQPLDKGRVMVVQDEAGEIVAEVPFERALT
jgi:hypothetical protein